MADIARFGLDVGIYGPLATPATVLDLARFAEAAGFESLWLADHVVFPTRIAAAYPYGATGGFPAPLSDPLLEPLAVMGVLVGATTRLRIGTAVLIMPYRNPVLLARMLITLDQFSGGRIVLGAGVGWLEEEFEVLDTAAFARRGKVTDEYLEIFKALSAGGEVGYAGETYRFAPVFSNPGSATRPHPPILIGGLSNAALRRVARLGDGWLAVTLAPDQLGERLAKLRALAGEQGRRPDDLRLVYKMFLNPGDPKPSRFGAREPGSGSWSQIAEDLKAVLDLGFETVILRHRGGDLAAMQADLDRIVTDLIPAL